MASDPKALAEGAGYHPDGMGATRRNNSNKRNNSSSNNSSNNNHTRAIESTAIINA